MKSKHIIIVTAVILIITVILLFYLNSTNEKEVVQRFQAGQLVASRQLAREIKSYLHNRAQGVNVLSTFPSFQNRDMKKIAADIQTFFYYVKKDYVKAVSVYDEKGTIIYSTTKEAIGRNYAECDFFQWAAQKENKGKQFVSSLIQTTDNQTAPLPYFRFLIAAPIYKEVKNTRSQKSAHKFVGVVTSTIDLEEVISAFLPLVSAHTTKEHAYILDRNGTLLYHSEHPEMVLRNIRSQDKTCFQCHTSFDHVETILSGKEGNVEFALKERPKELAGFSSTEFMNISWKIVICLPYQEVSGFVNKSLYMTLILIGIITLTLIVSSTLIYRSNRSKMRAQEEAKQWMEKHELENKIRESEEHYKTVVDISPDAIIIHCEGKIVFVNPAAVKLVDASSQNDLLGKPAIEFVHPDDRESVGKRILEILKSGKSSQWLEERFIRMDGSIINVEVISTPTTFNGKTSLQVIVHDITERRQAEEELKQSEEKFRSFAEESPSMIFINKAGHVVYVNKKCEEVLGYSKEEFLDPKFNFLDLIAPEYVEMIKENFADRYKGKATNSYEYALLTKDKRRIDTSVASKIIHYEDGSAILGTVTDITERKHAEEEIIQIKEKMQMLVEGTPHLFFYVQDANANIQYISPSIKEITGHTIEQWIDQKHWFATDSPINQIAKEKTHKNLNGKINLEPILVEVKHTDGHPILLEVYEKPIFRSNKVVGLQGVAHDITQRKRAEEEIISQKNKFAQLFENSPVAIALLDDQYKIIQFNESFSALFGYYLEEIKGQEIDDIIVPPELKEEAKSYSDQTRESNQINKESYRKKKDGSNIFVQVIGVPIVINDKTIGIYGMYVDLTQRKEVEEKMKLAKELAEQSDKLKSEFLAQMSHEIRTPLNAVVGNVDYLNGLFDESMDADARDCFDGIGLASKRIIRTVDLILNAAELQTSGYNPYKVKVDLNSETLNKLYKEHQLLAKQKGLELIYKCEVKESKVIADEYSITQIFANLIDNAIKYTKKGKVEILLLKNKTGNIIVEIKDTGIGMSKEFLPKLFEPFVQEDHGFTRSYDGSGLGLTLVKNYCDINNATIEVESEKNVGTTFRIIFKS